jgi:hypothetical protein
MYRVILILLVAVLCGCAGVKQPLPQGLAVLNDNLSVVFDTAGVEVVDLPFPAPEQAVSAVKSEVKDTNTTPAEWCKPAVPYVLDMDSLIYFTNTYYSPRVVFRQAQDSYFCVLKNPAAATDKHPAWRKVDFAVLASNRNGAYYYVYVTKANGDTVDLTLKKTGGAGIEIGVVKATQPASTLFVVGHFTVAENDGDYQLHLVQTAPSTSDLLVRKKVTEVKDSRGRLVRRTTVNSWWDTPIFQFQVAGWQRAE